MTSKHIVDHYINGSLPPIAFLVLFTFPLYLFWGMHAAMWGCCGWSIFVLWDNRG